MALLLQRQWARLLALSPELLRQSPALPREGTRREHLDREMLELIKDVRDSIKAPSSPLKNGQVATALGSDEIAALMQRQGSPLA